MESSTETTLNIAAPATIRQYFEVHVSITSPANNAKFGDSSFTITGTASCEAFKDQPGEDHLSLGDATDRITGVTVNMGDTNSFQPATPTGSDRTPWATWSFAANTTKRGRLTIIARVGAAHQGFEGASATDDSQ